MKKNAGFMALLVCCAAVAGLGYGEPVVEDCGQLLVPPDRAMLGIEYAQEAHGLSVKSVVPGGPAEKAGLVAGDLIVEINGDTLLFRDRVAAVKWLNRYRADQVLRVVAHRNGARKTLELRGERITCAAAKRLDRLLHAAETEGLDAACSTGEVSATDQAELDDSERTLAFLEKFPTAGGILVLTASLNGAPVSIEVDVPLRGKPPELGSLPDFMQELAGRLGEGESISFHVKPQSRTYEVLTFPAHFWPDAAAQE